MSSPNSQIKHTVLQLSINSVSDTQYNTAITCQLRNITLMNQGNVNLIKRVTYFNQYYPDRSAWFYILPFSKGNAVSSTSPPVRYLDDPWLFFGFFFNDRLANGSIRSTNVPADDILTYWYSPSLNIWILLETALVYLREK